MKTANIEVTYVNHCGDDLSTVNAARVSFHKESEWDIDSTKNVFVLSQQDTKLIKYLAKHKHFSPFNHAFLSFRVKAPIFVARQLVKHKFLPWNEVSRRYVDDEPEFYFPEFWRKRAENVKQGSSDEVVQDPSLGIYEVQQSLHLYNHALGAGYAPEQARMFLPQNTMTTWIWSGTLGAFCDMLRLRLDPHTQYESRLVAEQIYDKVKQLFPVSVGALLDREVSPT
jgi:thymidylate synthase (FAD)